MENRELAKLPTFQFNVRTWRDRQEYTKYFDDHFGFRSVLVRINFLLRHELLGRSPSAKVLFGKDGWLFYAGDRTVDDYRGITRFDDIFLTRSATNYEIKRRWLAKQGIKYLLIVVPNKEYIYGEFLPNYIVKLRNRTGLDDFIDYLKKHTDVEILDIRQTLLREKQTEQVYLKTDTHWNDYGAYIVYRELMRPVGKWFPVSKTKELDEFNIETKTVSGGDLAFMVGGEIFLKEEHKINISHKVRNSRDIKTNYSPRGPFVARQDNSELPRILVFGDSFFNSVFPFLSEQCQDLIFFRRYWETETPIEDMIRIHKPDIVIEEKAERFLKSDASDLTKNTIFSVLAGPGGGQ